MISNLKFSFKLIIGLYLRLNKTRKFHFKIIFLFAIFTSLFEVASLLSLYPFLTVLLGTANIEDLTYLHFLQEKFSINSEDYLLLLTIIFFIFPNYFFSVQVNITLGKY